MQERSQAGTHRQVSDLAVPSPSRPDSWRHRHLHELGTLLIADLFEHAPVDASEDSSVKCHSSHRRCYRTQLHQTDARSTGIPLSLIHISEPTRRTPISYAVFC